MRCLIVDDSEMDRTILKKFLSKTFECQEVANGQDAVKLFEQMTSVKKPFDLICLDIMLPDLPGFEVLQKIRNVEKTVGLKSTERSKILMTTGLGGVRDVLKATNLGCSSYLVKPIDKERLGIEMAKMSIPFKWD